MTRIVYKKGLKPETTRIVYKNRLKNASKKSVGKWAARMLVNPTNHTPYIKWRSHPMTILVALVKVEDLMAVKLQRGNEE